MFSCKDRPHLHRQPRVLILAPQQNRRRRRHRQTLLFCAFFLLFQKAFALQMELLRHPRHIRHQILHNLSSS